MFLLALLLFAGPNEILKEFKEFLSIPNIAADSANIRRNAEWLVKAMQARGLEVKLLETEGAPPVVFGERKSPSAKRTFVFYAHYDGQPIDEREWKTKPFEPVVDSERIWARGASDDKAAIIAMLAALDRVRDQDLNANLKFFFEGEEEAGSPHLERFVAQNKDRLKADAWFICDGPVHQSRRQQLFFGVRGVAPFEITIYGPNRELHSGHYGNWAPNPAMMLAQLLSSMKDDDGHVLVEHFYDGVTSLGALERQAISEEPSVDDRLRNEFGLRRTEGNGRRLIEAVNQPSLNVRGLASAGVGALARNVVPATATAAMDIRLVQGLTVEGQMQRVVEHIRKQGYFVVDREPDSGTRLAYPKIALVRRKGGYNASGTPMDLAISREVIAAVEKARGPVVKLPTLGGSVPLFILQEQLHTPWIGVPIANHDNNQHAANENLRLQNLWDGIELMITLMRL
jgi:acetylornithine deacetylase/succinyl-diaminopimelate desuccinylase-like protein